MVGVKKLVVIEILNWQATRQIELIKIQSMNLFGQLAVAGAKKSIKKVRNNKTKSNLPRLQCSKIEKRLATDSFCSSLAWENFFHAAILLWQRSPPPLCTKIFFSSVCYSNVSRISLEKYLKVLIFAKIFTVQWRRFTVNTIKNSTF